MPGGTTEYDGVTVHHIGHSAVRIDAERSRIYVDCFADVLDGDEPAGDMVFSTHGHWDHFDAETCNRLTDDTVVTHATTEGTDLDVETHRQLRAGESLSAGDVTVRAVPAHNLVRMREPGTPYHPEGSGVGYVLEVDGVELYHPGDTEPLDHMVDVDPDVMFVPIGGAFVASLDDAFWMVHMVQPDVAIPVHYGFIDDSRQTAEGFEAMIERLREETDSAIQAVVL